MHNEQASSPNGNRIVLSSDRAALGERCTRAVLVSAIAKTRLRVGALFLAPVSTLNGADGIYAQVDSVRVARRDTLTRGKLRPPALVLERSGGTQLWVDETTGAEVLSRGNAGPGRWGWHIRRGVKPSAAGSRRQP